MSSAADYNRDRIAEGALQPRHLTRAIELLQAELGVTVDGYFGPGTLAAWRERYELSLPEPSAWALSLLEVAREEVGHGERYADNAGPDVHRYRDFPKRDRYHEPVGYWCAFFAGYCIEEGAKRIGREPPTWRRWYDARHGRMMPVGSAKSLGARALADGVQVASPELVIPGDIVVTHRGKNPRAGHVEIVETSLDARRGTIGTIGGNVGKFPSKVRRFSRDAELLDVAMIVRL